MRRIACAALLAAAACGGDSNPEAGPLDRLHFPTGVAVLRQGDGDGVARLLVASSNADLRYDDETGGAVLALDPSQDPARLSGAVNVPSFAGDLAVADPDACASTAGAADIGPDPLALVATRGSNTLQVLRVSPEGALSLDRELQLTGPFRDPLAIAVACGGGRSRAFVGHVISPSGQAWVSEYDLASRALRSFAIGPGPARGFAYDAARDRLYVAGLATGAPTPLRFVQLAGCTPGAAADAGGCTVGQAVVPSPTPGFEVRAIALSTPPATPGPSRRAYLTGREYDLTDAARAGGRTSDFGGLLLVVDLVENALGGVDVRLVRERRIGRGAQDVRVLPSRGAGRGDLVAALSVEDGVLWLYDDETGALRAFRRDDAPTFDPDTGTTVAPTGAPVLGHQPYGLAVDPVAAGSVGRVYVGSFSNGWVTPVHVPLDAADPLDAAFVVTTSVGGRTQPRRITGGTP